MRFIHILRIWINFTLWIFPQIERCYYFLHSYVETAQRKEPVEGRLVQFLLSNPSNDGGQWDMLVNLIGSCHSTTADINCSGLRTSWWCQAPGIG